jgi:fructokinase
MKKIYGGIEAGGTKFVCAVGSGPDDIQSEIRFSTTSPEETLDQAIQFFTQIQREYPLIAMGVASFGPVDLMVESRTYGFITKTPKQGWSDTDVVSKLKQVLNIPIAFDTDVNGALFGEYRWGAAQGMENSIYLTIGTGIGGGAMVNGNLVHGLVHPEMGHMRLPHDVEKDPYPGCCPFHGDCFEGLAAGPAVEDRWGQKAATLPLDHPAWDLEAHYIAQALHTLICVYSPQRIILGGGIMNQNQLFPLVRQSVQASLNGYVQHSSILEEIDALIVPPKLGNQAGVLGAIALAQTIPNLEIGNEATSLAE